MPVPGSGGLAQSSPASLHGPGGHAAPRREMSNGLFAFLLMLPALVVVTFVIIYPLLNAVATSFFRYFLTDDKGRVFIGLGNYAAMLGSGSFWTAFFNTVLYVAGTVIGEFVVAFALALLVNYRHRFTNLVNSLFFVPWIIPSVVVALIARFLFFDNYHGIVNVVLHGLGLIKDFVPWLKDPVLAMPVVTLTTIWKMFPFMFVVLYAGLLAIPLDEIEAAKIDGAGAIQRFFHVTLPNMREIIALATILEFVWQFQYLTIIWTTTRGGPINRTTTLPILIYQYAFHGSMDMGFGSSIGVFWMVFLLGFCVIYVRLVGRKEA
jgi:multiple sugar transport system permease protein